MDDLELTKTIDQVRRAMPRNSAVMTICDELQSRIRGFAQPSAGLIVGADKIIAASVPAGFDRNAYMRGYMKERRAKRAKP